MEDGPTGSSSSVTGVTISCVTVTSMVSTWHSKLVGIMGSLVAAPLEGTVGSSCVSASMVMGSCSLVSIAETSLARGDLNAVGCGASGVGSSGVFPAACLANNSLTAGAWSSELQPQELVPRTAWAASEQEWPLTPVVLRPGE